MNGFTLQAMGLKSLIEHGKIEDSESLQREIKINEFLGTLTNEEMLHIFDSGYFNTTVKRYVKKACKNCNVDEETTDNILSELHYLFDECKAQEI